MFKAFREFLLDDSGAVTADSAIVMGGVIWMAGAVVSDVSVATMGVTDKINERLEYASIIAEIVGSPSEGAENGDTGSDEGVDCVGNPGNDKCVGNAGENPNGQGGWGDGTQGQSQ